ncbi:MAG: amidase family protein [Hydrocarboniphaga sp.]|uniref:amidase n=1 Tax=Hydrocarboniphaga sp. TaxID=2033016 RepID=UPI002624B5F9|nr:amidase [Hydrocarboniphaga sp.]MDB5970941.1 amidase family protein [Hydrocarboniphaga sp.]
MNFSEYVQHDALGLAALVQRREVSAAELLEAALQRCAEVNPKINALTIPMTAQARARSSESVSGPFAGVPFLIKDIGQHYAGVPTTQGSRATREHAPAEHAEVTRRFLAAGVTIFGKTSTPELALKGVTEPARFGICRNPWNLDRTPGGSSGGAAAAVAAGIVPMAGASDGGGSIRIPAACCGLFGLRPSRGRVPAGPTQGEIWDGASSEHVLTRSVRDSAAMLDALQGADVGAPFVIAPPHEPYRDAMQRAPGRLRIGYTTRSPIGTPVDAECVAAIEDTARLLRDLGHSVDAAEPQIDGMQLARAYLHMYFGQTAATLAQIRAQTGASASEFELETRVLALLGDSLSAGEYVAWRGQWNDFARALGRYFQSWDLYLTPVLATPPIAVGGQLPAWQRLALKPLLAMGASLGVGALLRRSGLVEEMAVDSLRHVPFTQLSNLTGTPSMSVPLHWTQDGLPLGTQFIAPFGREDRLLQLAAQLEQARPWFDKRAPL